MYVPMPPEDMGSQVPNPRWRQELLRAMYGPNAQVAPSVPPGYDLDSVFASLPRASTIDQLGGQPSGWEVQVGEPQMPPSVELEVGMPRGEMRLDVGTPRLEHLARKLAARRPRRDPMAEMREALQRATQGR